LQYTILELEVNDFNMQCCSCILRSCSHLQK